MKITRHAFVLFAGLLLAGCSPAGPVGNTAVPQPAQAVDLEKYLGRWYELARYEASFQKGCEAVTAEYSQNTDGSIAVLNSCRQDSVYGELRTAKGTAHVVQDTNNAKLRVSFFWPFYGDYWVIDRAADYSWSIVGEPSGRYLWILSREPRVSAELWTELLQRTAKLGYNTDLLRITRQQ